MALIRNDKFSTVNLNKEVRKVWDNKNPNVTYSEKDTEEASIFKVAITVNLHDIQPDSVIAEGLVNQALDMLKSVSDQEFTSYITSESIVMGSIITTENEVNNYLTSYYTGCADLNPPDIRAWLVIRGTFPDAPTGGEYVMIDGERQEVIR